MSVVTKQQLIEMMHGDREWKDEPFCKVLKRYAAGMKGHVVERDLERLKTEVQAGVVERCLVKLGRNATTLWQLSGDERYWVFGQQMYDDLDDCCWTYRMTDDKEWLYYAQMCFTSGLHPTVSRRAAIKAALLSQQRVMDGLLWRLARMSVEPDMFTPRDFSEVCWSLLTHKEDQLTLLHARAVIGMIRLMHGIKSAMTAVDANEMAALVLGVFWDHVPTLSIWCKLSGATSVKVQHPGDGTMVSLLMVAARSCRDGALAYGKMEYVRWDRRIHERLSLDKSPPAYHKRNNEIFGTLLLGIQRLHDRGVIGLSHDTLWENMFESMKMKYLLDALRCS